MSKSILRVRPCEYRYGRMIEINVIDHKAHRTKLPPPILESEGRNSFQNGVARFGIIKFRRKPFPRRFAPFDKNDAMIGGLLPAGVARLSEHVYY